MARHRLLRATFTAVTFTGALLAFALSPQDKAISQKCTCRSIGPGTCIPDPACFQGLGKAVDKAVQDLGTMNWTSEKRTIAIEKAASEAIGRLNILETGYSQLSELAKEEPGYGLYSYAVITSDSNRSVTFLNEIFKSVPPINDTAAARAQLNIFYIPLKSDKAAEFAQSVKSSQNDTDPSKLGPAYTRSFYDYKMGRAILNHVCNPPADPIREICKGDLSRGPYIFTYGKPASSLEPVPPPFLFADLSDVHERAFGEFVAAFKSQVKQEDISDGARINSLRLRVLNVVLTAADWISPIQKAVADIVHSTSGDTSKK
jgi:hypothetical protein